MGRLIDEDDVIGALIEEGWRSKRYKLGEIWELNLDEIRKAIATVPTAQPKMIELKPCPFCGGEVEMYNDTDIMGKYWYIRCKKCYSRGTRVYESLRELEPQEEYAAIIGVWKKAAEAWNKRVEDGALN